MTPLAQNGSQFGHQQDPNRILNECREIDRAIDSLTAEGGLLSGLRVLQGKDLNATDTATFQRQLEAQNADIMATFRNLVDRMKAIKQMPESGSPKNSPQVGKVDRRLKAAKQQYQSQDADYSRRVKEQMARQYRIVRPEASEREIQDAVESDNSQVFSQALMQSDRRGQAQSAFQAVKGRHEEIQKVARQMEELVELFQEMENLVVQQEAAVTNIEMKGEEVVENMDKGTEQIGVAVKSARNARKWKWWCLGICGKSSSTTILWSSRRVYYWVVNFQHLHLYTLHQANIPPHSPHHHHHCRGDSDLQIRHPKQPRSQSREALRLDRLYSC